MEIALTRIWLNLKTAVAGVVQKAPFLGNTDTIFIYSRQ
jgi:hypothetical protein